MFDKTYRHALLSTQTKFFQTLARVVATSIFVANSLSICSLVTVASMFPLYQLAKVCKLLSLKLPM